MIEPESSEFWIDSGANVRLVFGERAGVLEMECLGGGMVVYARQAGEVEVYQNGRRLARGRRSRRMASRLLG